MKGAVTILQAVLIFAITLSMIVAAIPWLTTSIDNSLTMSEMGNIRDQMGLCNDKLVETARTGTSSKCLFSANRGTITAQGDGIYYALLSKGDICDNHDWAEVDKERHLESKCDVTYSTNNYNLRWRWPKDIDIQGSGFTGTIIKGSETKDNITFDSSLDFKTLTVVVNFEYIEGQVGKTLEISRNALLEDKAILGVNIY
ncbi:MAG: hypothetical protein KJ906_02660 [Nanoarchaeota archaeon]|nr:hypothetical protein [Nanoarchaeota archaeon]